MINYGLSTRSPPEALLSARQHQLEGGNFSTLQIRRNLASIHLIPWGLNGTGGAEILPPALVEARASRIAGGRGSVVGGCREEAAADSHAKSSFRFGMSGTLPLAHFRLLIQPLDSPLVKDFSHISECTGASFICVVHSCSRQTMFPHARSRGPRPTQAHLCFCCLVLSRNRNYISMERKS